MAQPAAAQQSAAAPQGPRIPSVEPGGLAGWAPWVTVAGLAHGAQQFLEDTLVGIGRLQDARARMGEPAVHHG